MEKGKWETIEDLNEIFENKEEFYKELLLKELNMREAVVNSSELRDFVSDCRLADSITKIDFNVAHLIELVEFESVKKARAEERAEPVLELQGLKEIGKDTEEIIEYIATALETCLDTVLAVGGDNTQDKQ